ncbi:MAG: hypothetical protein MUC87_10885 [Bacteroidia bacterium]|jgi:hypothetical protein|nr:hypothetical protein [Bacteroidia bacterium]
MQEDKGLFQLISSLSPTEKRYFKLFARRHVVGETNDYVLIFDAIDEQVAAEMDYDESVVAKRLKAQGRKPALRAAKSYLSALILRSMRQFADESDTHRMLEARLHDIRFLLEKGLVNKAQAMLRKTKKIAAHYEKPQLMLELLAAERQIVRLLQSRHTETLLDQLETDENLAMAQWQTELELRRIYDRLHLHIRSASRPTAADRQFVVADFAAHPLVRKRSETHTFGAEVLRLNILSDLASLEGDHKKSRSQRKRIIALYESYPHQQRDQVLRYINVLNNYITSCFQLGIFDEFPALIAKMKSFENISREVRYQVFRNGVLLELIYLMNSRRPEEGLQLLPEIENGLRMFERKLPVARMLSFRYNVVMLYFINERMSDALRVLNVLRRREHPDVRRDIQHAARLFQLILHFELNRTDDFLDSLMRSTQRHLREHNLFGQFEQWLFKTLRNLTETADKRQRRQAFATALEEHRQLAAKGLRDLLMDETGLWLQSRATGKTLQEVFVSM